MLDDSPNTVASTAAGATYAASAWVRAPSGRTVHVAPARAERRHGRPHELADGDGDGGWRQLAVTSAAASGGTSLSVEVVVSLTTSAKAQVDDVSLKRT